MQEINIDNDYGSIFGYVVNTEEEQPENFLYDYTDHAPLIAEWLSENCDSVAIFKNLSVEPEKRGQGHGSRLMDEAMDEASCACAYMLISDRGESQAEGFVLDDFYARRGFEVVTETNAGNLMVAPGWVAQQLREALSKGELKD
jgi:GNAT superfamily N-acetyltransferase